MTRGYGQFCPVAKAAEIFCERWNALLLREFAAGSRRFSQLQRGVPLMSPSMLSRRLKELEAEGVIASRSDAGTKVYELTPAGAEFVPVVMALGTWGQRWTRRQLRDDEIDHGLLLWDMERRVRGEALGADRSVVQLAFTDLPAAKRVWWFLHHGPNTQLCVHDPGFAIDLYLSASVADMIRVWRGDVAVTRALAEDRVEAHGSRAMIGALERWLNLSPLADIAPAGTAADD